MREIIRDFKGKCTSVNPSKLKPEFSPDCSDVKFSPIHQLRTRLGFDKVGTTSFNEPITLIDQIENDGTFVNTFIQGTSMYEGDYIVVAYPTLQAIGGSPAGTPITNVTELQAMQNDLTASYYLANNIDASATSGWNGGAGFDPVGTSANKFTGIFDGDGHTITDLFINRSSNLGLFGTTNNAEIKNVGLINVDISGNIGIGALIGKSFSSIIINCYCTGSVSGDESVGGLISYGNQGIITNCYSTCAVSGNFSVGGLSGWTTGVTYNDCFWDTETSGQASSAGGTGKTTAEMQTQSTFTNWDFTTIWEIV